MSRSLTIDSMPTDGSARSVSTLREEAPHSSAGSPSKEKDKGDRKIAFMCTILLAFAYSVSIGFVGSCATTQPFYPGGLYVIAAGNAFAAVFTVLFLVRKPKDIAVILIEVFLPIMLVCIFLFSFVGHAGKLACIFIMLALLACHDIVDIAERIEKLASFRRELRENVRGRQNVERFGLHAWLGRRHGAELPARHRCERAAVRLLCAGGFSRGHYEFRRVPSGSPFVCSLRENGCGARSAARKRHRGRARLHCAAIRKSNALHRNTI